VLLQMLLYVNCMWLYLHPWAVARSTYALHTSDFVAASFACQTYDLSFTGV